MKLLTTKLKSFREKQAASLKERRLLRDQLKKRQNELKDEKKKYKILQKEVDKMAKLMREHEGEGMDEDDDTVEEEVIIIRMVFLLLKYDCGVSWLIFFICYS